LGADRNNFTSVQTASFQKPIGSSQNELKNSSPFLYLNHFSLGHPTNYNSTYSRNLKPYEISKEVQSRNQKMFSETAILDLMM